MEKPCVIFVIKKLFLLLVLDFIWTWILNFSKLLKYGLRPGLSFKKSGLDLDCKI